MQMSHSMKQESIAQCSDLNLLIVSLSGGDRKSLAQAMGRAMDGGYGVQKMHCSGLNLSVCKTGCKTGFNPIELIPLSHFCPKAKSVGLENFVRPVCSEQTTIQLNAYEGAARGS